MILSLAAKKSILFYYNFFSLLFFLFSPFLLFFSFFLFLSFFFFFFFPIFSGGHSTSSGGGGGGGGHGPLVPPLATGLAEPLITNCLAICHLFKFSRFLEKKTISKFPKIEWDALSEIRLRFPLITSSFEAPRERVIRFPVMLKGRNLQNNIPSYDV